MVDFPPTNVINQSIPVAARSKVWVYGRSLAGIAGSNTAGGVHGLSSVSVLCCQAEISLRRTEYSSRKVLLSVVFLSVIENPHKGGLGPLGLSSHAKKKNAISHVTPTKLA